MMIGWEPDGCGWAGCPKGVGHQVVEGVVGGEYNLKIYPEFDREPVTVV